MRWCWVNFQCRGVLLIWIIVGQGPAALAVGAGGGCLDIFSLVCRFSSLSPSVWETARYRLKYCLKGPLSPKQPTHQLCSTIYEILVMTLYALLLPELPTVGQGPIVLAVGAGWVVWTFLLSSVLSLLFLPLFGRRSDIDLNTVSKGR